MDDPVGPAAPSPASGAIVARIRAAGPALVALSGGVDSAVVAALARQGLGDRMLTATVVSAATSAEERRSAERVAAALGVPHVFVPAEPLEEAEYRRNGEDRCFHCRRVEGRALRELGEREHLRQFLDGVHADDLGEERPGLRAMNDSGFEHPLLWAGWGKAEVRLLARELHLPNAERPSNACLASRVARGEPITEELLRRVEQAEKVLLDRGFRQVRVRARAGSARIEVDRSEVERLELPALHDEVVDALLALGFRSVAVDPRGYAGRELLPTLP